MHKILPIFLLAINQAIAADISNLPSAIVNVAETPMANATIDSSDTKENTLSKLTDADLKNDFILTQNLLNQAINIRRWDLVERIFAIYVTFPQVDATLVKYAKAGLERYKGNLEESITHYRDIIAEKPKLTPVRLELAIALFENKQDEAARDQFDKVLSASPPETIQTIVNKHIEALNKRDSWSWNLGLNYLKEDNINNISSERNIENTGFIKGDQMMPKTGKGLSYYLNASRNYNINNNHYLSVENSLYGKSFWSHHSYDDIVNRFSIGYSNMDSKRKISVLPFYEKRWYGNRQYKDNIGLRFEYNYWLSPNLQTINALEYSKQYYKDYKQLDGYNKLLSSTLFWLTKPDQFFFAGVDLHAERTGIRQYSSDLINLRLGWGEEWGAGISTRLSLGVGQRKYKDKAVIGDLIPLNKIRKDKEYLVNLTLWKRDWHFLGITPKLNYQWRKVDSNIPSMYSYNKNRFMVLFEKTF